MRWCSTLLWLQYRCVLWLTLFHKCLLAASGLFCYRLLAFFAEAKLFLASLLLLGSIYLISQRSDGDGCLSGVIGRQEVRSLSSGLQAKLLPYMLLASTASVQNTGMFT